MAAGSCSVYGGFRTSSVVGTSDTFPDFKQLNLVQLIDHYYITRLFQYSINRIIFAALAYSLYIIIIIIIIIYLNQTTYGSINTQNKHMQTRKHTHTHNSKIAYYTNTQRMITCTSLLEQDDSLLTNVDFALCITVL